ncbi:O-antigen ligase family protein [Butyricimonas sp. Marseille-P3923]|uniref:O-antigen ligase family protein n=1 Tax=Butyricimonas sp. Marseille-P3923 TaxID=1987504 RepID=UPI000C085906|nr:O-antigen ligase family protein [Butyricimonas sp. Marseille-P3923]
MFALKNVPLYFILLLAPVLFHVDRSLPGITAGFAGMLLLLVCLVVFPGSRRCRFNLLDLFFLLFVTWYTGRTVGIGSSIFAWKLLLGGAAIMLYVYVRNTGVRVYYFDVLFVAGIFQAMWFWTQLRGWLPSYHYLYPGTGGFMNPAILAVFLAIACLAGLVGFYRREKFYLRCLRGIGIVLLLITLGFLGSRAAWVGLGIGILWIVLTGREWGVARFFGNIREKYRIGKYIFLLLAIVVPVSIIYVLYLVHPVSVQGRFLIWRVAGTIFRDAPWFGCGSFSAAYMPAQGAWFEMRPDSPFVSVAGNNEYAFNEFLRVVCETGIVGLLLFVGVVVMGLYFAAKGNRVSRFAGGVLVVILGFGLFSYPLSVELVSVVAIISLAIVARDARHAREWVVDLDTSFAFILRIAVVLFLFVLSIEYYHEKKADILLTEAREVSSRMKTSELKVCYERLGGNPDFVLRYGRTLYTRGDLLNAQPVLEKGLSLRPTSELASDLGKCYFYQGRWKEAEQKYRLAANMIPNYIVPHHLLFKLYQLKGMPEEAGREARQMLTIPVKVVNSSVIRARGEARAFLEENGEQS